MKFKMILTASLLLAGIAIPSAPQTKPLDQTAVVPKSAKEPASLKVLAAGGVLKGTIVVKEIEDQALAKVFTCKDITIAVGRIRPQTTGSITIDTFQVAASAQATGDIKTLKCEYSISNIPLRQRLTIDTWSTGSKNFNCTTLSIQNDNTLRVIFSSSRTIRRDFNINLDCINIG